MVCPVFPCVLVPVGVGVSGVTTGDEPGETAPVPGWPLSLVPGATVAPTGAGDGTAVGSMTNPESRSTSSACMGLPTMTLSRLTWNFPSVPTLGGGPLVYASLASATPRAIATRSALAESRRGGSKIEKNASLISLALTPYRGG